MICEGGLSFVTRPGDSYVRASFAAGRKERRGGGGESKDERYLETRGAKVREREREDR